MPLDHVARLRCEDVRAVRGPNRRAVRVERDEADSALDDERVTACRDHVSEAHPPDGIGREPRFETDLDRRSGDVESAAEWPAGGGDVRGRLADAARDGDVV